MNFDPLYLIMFKVPRSTTIAMGLLYLYGEIENEIDNRDVKTV